LKAHAPQPWEDPLSKTAASFRAAILAALIAAPACAQSLAQDPASGATRLDLAAEGEARVVPDIARVAVGAETTALSAREAMAANAETMSRVLAALRRAGVAERDVQTTTIGVAPQYAYEQGRPPRLTGYQASNEVSVTVRDLAALGPVIDAAAGAGATTIGAVSLGLAEPVAARNTARIAAVKALEDKASLYARAVGYHIVRLVRLEEGAPMVAFQPRSMALMAAKAVAAAPTPVEAGETTVRIEITGSFELAR
jgi:uncharacterized protein YggE